MNSQKNVYGVGMESRFKKRKEVELCELVGKKIAVIKGLDKGSEEVRVFTECGYEYLFSNEPDGGKVELEDFECDIEALVGAVIISAEISTNEHSEGDDNPPHKYVECWTWSFYKIETTKGELWMRWLGESNGYYSEDVSLVLVNGEDKVVKH
ncbi:hypothetical protein [Shewanella sp. UCD-KL12]|uniref:DUF7448 domain-containing protein n=1 Tax=Shewanella sp. UCD-KL12 TaxID=1917163 RepID=UPI0009F9ED4C|nr:hypothetical protein [Shewanella sp. UCD-KL12]